MILLLSLGSVEPLHYGITMNVITKNVGTTTYDNGRYLIGPFDSFIKYPSYLVTVEFSDSPTADVIKKILKKIYFI